MFEDIRRQQELQKANILRGFGINPENEDLELEIFKAQETDIEKAKHQDGDMHPNGKWVWVSSANGGKGDWRTIGGRAHKKHQAGAGGSTTSGSTTAPQPKKSTVPKTDKERLDLQQEYATLSQLVKKPSTSSANKKNFQDRMKEIEGMGLQVVKGKFQWKDTGTAATPQSGTTTPKDKKILMDNLQTEHLKNAPEGHIITAEKPGNNQGVYQKYVKLADGYWKNPVTNQRYTNAQMKQRLEGLHKNLYGVDLGGLTESKPKEQKKLRPVGTGTNGPERRKKTTSKETTKTKKK